MPIRATMSFFSFSLNRSQIGDGNDGDCDDGVGSGCDASTK